MLLLYHIVTFLSIPNTAKDARFDDMPSRALAGKYTGRLLHFPKTYAIIQLREATRLNPSRQRSLLPEKGSPMDASYAEFLWVFLLAIFGTILWHTFLTSLVLFLLLFCAHGIGKLIKRITLLGRASAILRARGATVRTRRMTVRGCFLVADIPPKIVNSDNTLLTGRGDPPATVCIRILPRRRRYFHYRFESGDRITLYRPRRLSKYAERRVAAMRLRPLPVDQCPVGTQTVILFDHFPRRITNTTTLCVTDLANLSSTLDTL